MKMTNVAHVLQGQTTAYILNSNIDFRRWRDKDNKPTEKELIPIHEEQKKFMDLVQQSDISDNVGKDKEKIGGLNVIRAIDEYFGDIPKKLFESIGPIRTELTKIDNYCRTNCNSLYADCASCDPLKKAREKEG